jgi:hypothetical protein
MNTTMTLRRRTLRMLAALGAGLALGACGAGSSQGAGSGGAGATAGNDAGRIVAASADATNAARSARMSMTIAITEQGYSGAVTAEGAFDFANRTGALTMDMSAMRIPGVQGAIGLRVVDGVIYMNLGSMLGSTPEARQLFGDKPWIKLDVTKAGGVGAAAGGFGGLGTSDPTSTLDALRGAGSDVRVVGHDEVRGVETTHYHATIDLERALDKLPAAQRDRAARAMQELGTGSVPADVWIDAQGRLRKLTMTLDATTEGTHVGAVTMELYDFGTPVDVQAPPADQVTDLGSMLGGVTGGLLGRSGAGNANGVSS